MKNICLATEVLYDNCSGDVLSYTRNMFDMFDIIHVKYRYDSLYFLDSVIKFNVIYERN